MEISFDNDALTEELMHKMGVNVGLSKELRDLVKFQFTKEVLEQACPQIQAFLKMASSLPTKRGMQQFYDTQSELAKKAKGWRGKSNTNDPHLIEMWEVSYKQKTDGNFIIIVNNDKRVAGRSSYYELFELLWNGTDIYVAPVRLSMEEAVRLRKTEGAKQQFFERAKKEPVKFGLPAIVKKQVMGGKLGGTKSKYHIMGLTSAKIKVGGRKSYSLTEPSAGKQNFARFVSHDTEQSSPFEQPYTTGAKRMSFYNRYSGRFYYNQMMRKGIGTDVVQDFHDYVSGCIVRGLTFALGEMFSSGTESMANAIGKTHYSR